VAALVLQCTESAWYLCMHKSKITVRQCTCREGGVLGIWQTLARQWPGGSGYLFLVTFSWLRASGLFTCACEYSDVITCTIGSMVYNKM